jgi:hypothetical protein
MGDEIHLMQDGVTGWLQQAACQGKSGAVHRFANGHPATAVRERIR